MSQQPEALKHAEWLERSLTIGAPEAAAELRRLRAVELEAIALRAQVERLQAAGQVVGGKDWSTPTTHLQRFGDAMQLLCNGHRPPDAMLVAWQDKDADDIGLQEFAIAHGPAWAQGIGVIDAALVLVEQPTEGIDHEMPTPAQEAADTGADELRNALQCLLASGGAIAEATAGELQSAIADPQAAPIVKNQAAAVLRARAALAASTGANVDAGMVMLTPLQYNQIPELCAISPRLYESIVRAIEAEFCRINGLTVGGIQASGGAE